MSLVRRMIPVAACLVMAACGKDNNDSPPPGGPPAVLTVVGQSYEDGTTRLPWGGVTGEATVLFRAALAANPDTASVRLLVEVVPFGMPFTGIPSASSGYVESRTVAQAAAPVPAAGDYAWRAWAEDMYARTSDFATFVQGPGAAFTVDPTAPRIPQQYRLNGLTFLPVGATTPEVGAWLQAVVRSPAGDMVRAQFEVKPPGTPFDGTGLAMGSVVSSGSISKAAPLLAVGLCRWRVRTEDYSGHLSLWVGFGGNDDAAPPEADLERTAPTSVAAPDAPSALAQLHTDGVTSIPLGGFTGEDHVILAATVSDAGGTPCALEVEVKPAGAAFDGSGTMAGAYVASGSTALAAVPVGAGAWHWQARTVDSQGTPSAWMLFGSPYAPAAPDFQVAPSANLAPYLPGSLAQFQFGGMAGMSAGDPVSGPGMVVKAMVSDPDPGNGLVLEVEVRPAGTPFSNVPGAASGLVANGTTVQITVTGLSPGNAYRWQARAIDSAGATSGWVEYSGFTASTPSPTYSGGTGGGGCGASIAARSCTPWLPCLLALALLALSLRRAS